VAQAFCCLLEQSELRRFGHTQPEHSSEILHAVARKSRVISKEGQVSDGREVIFADTLIGVTAPDGVKVYASAPWKGRLVLRV
jgi:hypothetical protein